MLRVQLVSIRLPVILNVKHFTSLPGALCILHKPRQSARRAKVLDNAHCLVYGLATRETYSISFDPEGFEGRPVHGPRTVAASRASAANRLASLAAASSPRSFVKRVYPRTSAIRNVSKLEDVPDDGTGPVGAVGDVTAASSAV